MDELSAKAQFSYMENVGASPQGVEGEDVGVSHLGDEMESADSGPSKDGIVSCGYDYLIDYPVSYTHLTLPTKA